MKKNLADREQKGDQMKFGIAFVDEKVLPNTQVRKTCETKS
jgi:hypothetical protein